jgi:hypothetical protein
VILLFSGDAQFAGIFCARQSNLTLAFEDGSMVTKATSGPASAPGGGFLPVPGDCERVDLGGGIVPISGAWDRAGQFSDRGVDDRGRELDRDQQHKRVLWPVRDWDRGC